MDPGWLSAVAGMLAAGTGTLVARRASKELDRWRTQQRETKRATVAGEVLVATLRFLTAMSSNTSVFASVSGDPDPNDEHKQMREGWRAGWQAVESISNDFIKAWELAETYLPEEVTALLERIWDCRAEIRASQMTFFSVPLGHGADFFKEGWGSGPNGRIEELRRSARRLLRPFAQMTTDETSPASEAAKQLAAESAEDQKQLAKPKG